MSPSPIASAASCSNGIPSAVTSCGCRAPGSSCANTRTIHPPCRQLLGEAVGAVVLLAATLKFDGTLTLQLQGKGLVNLLVAQCTHDFKVRAMARHEPLEWRRRGLPLAGGRGADRRHRRSHRSRLQLPGRGADHRRLAGRIASRRISIQSEQLPTRVLLAATRGRGVRHAGAAYSRRGRQAGAAGSGRARSRVDESRSRHARARRARRCSTTTSSSAWCACSATTKCACSAGTK